MAVVIDASSPALAGSSGAYYSFQAGDLLLKHTGAPVMPELTWTVIGALEYSWARAPQAGTCPASDLAFPSIRSAPFDPESTGVPWQP